MLDIVETQDVRSTAHFTLDNMKPYYDMYGVDWSVDDICEQTKGLSNFELQVHGHRIGVLRLSFENDRCQLRDIQIRKKYQNKGYGAWAITQVFVIAVERKFNFIELKVFKRSPAHRLYNRVGFKINNEDNRFYYMSAAVS